MNDVKYPEIEVELIGTDGNAFALIGRVTKALRRHGVDEVEIDAMRDDCDACWT